MTNPICCQENVSGYFAASYCFFYLLEITAAY